MTQKEAIEAIRKAVTDKGRVPQYHDQIAKKHREEWPMLWRAIDALLKARE